MKRLLLIVAFASCEGRCRVSDAVQDEMPRAFCVVDGHQALCMRGNELHMCSSSGAFMNTAQCTRIATLTHDSEARP